MRCPRETEVLSSELHLCKSHGSKLENLHRNVLSLCLGPLAQRKPWHHLWGTPTTRIPSSRVGVARLFAVLASRTQTSQASLT